MENKKSLTTLLIIFAVVLIGGSLYLFYFSKDEFSWSWLNFTKKTGQAEIQLQQIQAAKQVTEKNINDFIKGNKLDDLVGSEQYKGLVDPNISVSIGETGNPTPFTRPALPTANEEKK